MEFKDILKRLREGKKWTKTETAKRLNISTGSYANYEYGNREPNIDMIHQLADLFEVPISYFFSGKDPSEVSKMFNSFLETTDIENLEGYDIDVFMMLEKMRYDKNKNKNITNNLLAFLTDYPNSNFKESTIELLYSSLLFAQLNEPNNNEDDSKKIRFLNYIIDHLNQHLQGKTNFSTDELAKDLSEKINYIVNN